MVILATLLYLQLILPACLLKAYRKEMLSDYMLG